MFVQINSLFIGDDRYVKGDVTGDENGIDDDEEMEVDEVDESVLLSSVFMSAQGNRRGRKEVRG